MSDNSPVVKIPIVCSRTEKTRDINLPLEEVAEFLSRREAKKKSAAAVQAFIDAIPVSERPDLVAIYKGKGAVLANVDMKSDSIVGRAFNEVLDEEVFTLPAAKARKPRTKKTPEAGTPSVEVEPELTEDDEE
jgi:hypothetical protein